jgi:hypothetical protein
MTTEPWAARRGICWPGVPSSGCHLEDEQVAQAVKPEHEQEQPYRPGAAFTLLFVADWSTKY